MNLEDVQTTAKGLIESIPAVASAQIPVLIDDGVYPKIPAREAGLEAPGVVLIVFPPHCLGIEGDVARDGTAKYGVGIFVAIEVNTVRNTTQMGVERIINLVVSALSGKPNTNAPGLGFVPDSQPFVGFEVVDGIRQAVVAFRTVCFINPT